MYKQFTSKPIFLTSRARLNNHEGKTFLSWNATFCSHLYIKLFLLGSSPFSTSTYKHTKKTFGFFYRSKRFLYQICCFFCIITMVEVNMSKLQESLLGCWFWQKSKQRMHFTPMRASISTIGPPYGTKAPPPRSIPAEGLIHASRQRFTASLLALGSTVLIRSGQSTKEDFSSLTHTHMLKNISADELSPDCLSRWSFALEQAREIFAWTKLAVIGGDISVIIA